MDEKHDIRQELAIVLPSLDPDKKLCGVIDGLLAEGFEHIVIVDDGSDAAHQAPFEYAAGFPQCHILRHEVNKGKGRGLKDAFRYVLDEMPDIRGVVTIDGDGQHLTKDIVACGEKLLANEDKVVMGCRDFSQPGVPPRSVAGNRTTSFFFRLCYGIKLSDTQTGLRAIPRRYLDAFCGIEGERFEYETNMLLNMKRMGIGFVEQRIDTVYDSEDYSSHYNAIKDSWRIFKVMFKFLLSSLGSTVIDLLIFYLVFRIFKDQLGVCKLQRKQQDGLRQSRQLPPRARALLLPVHPADACLGRTRDADKPPVCEHRADYRNADKVRRGYGSFLHKLRHPA